MNVFIMRGIPMSGKTTWVTRQLKDLHHSAYEVCSADHFYIDAQGAYNFKPENIGQAHDQCLNDFIDAIADRTTESVFVDNTNLSAWEIAPYYRLAEFHKHKVEIIRTCCTFEAAMKRPNIHGVPADRLWYMYQTLLREQLPLHWKERFVMND